jgi:hypothetical protein
MIEWVILLIIWFNRLFVRLIKSIKIINSIDIRWHIVYNVFLYWERGQPLRTLLMCFVGNCYELAQR